MKEELIKELVANSKSRRVSDNEIEALVAFAIFDDFGGPFELGVKERIAWMDEFVKSKRSAELQKLLDPTKIPALFETLLAPRMMAEPETKTDTISRFVGLYQRFMFNSKLNPAFQAQHLFANPAIDLPLFRLDLFPLAYNLPSSLLRAAVHGL